MRWLEAARSTLRSVDKPFRVAIPALFSEHEEALDDSCF